MAVNRPVFIVELELRPEAGIVAPEIELRHLLKHLWRRYGWKCIAAREKLATVTEASS